jgi:HEAT repeat protein
MHIVDCEDAYLATVKVVPIRGKRKLPTGVKGSVRGALVTACILALAGCDGGPESRIRRAYELGRNPTEPNKNRLVALAGDSDRDVRANALVVLETIDSARAAALGRKALGDPDGVVRAAAIKVIAADAAADPELMRTLVGVATDDPSWLVRRRALAAVAAIDDPAVGEALSAALFDSIRYVRRTALEVGLTRPGFLPFDRIADLVSSDPDWENRVLAARALALSADPGAFAPLEAAAKDPNEFVRVAATRGRKALRESGIVPPPPPAPEPKPGSGV